MAVSRGPLRGPRPWDTGRPLPPRKQASGTLSDAFARPSGDDGNVTIVVPKDLLPQIKRIIQMNTATQTQTVDNTAANTAANVDQVDAAISETASKLEALRQTRDRLVETTKSAVTGSTAKRIAKATGIVAGVAALIGGGYYAYRRYAGA